MRERKAPRLERSIGDDEAAPGSTIDEVVRRADNSSYNSTTF